MPGTSLAILIAMLALLLLNGCAGTETFTRSARAGDTVALAVGWRQGLNKSNITVAITPAATGIPIIYGPDHPAIRAVFNLYPDPISSMQVSPRIDEDLTPYARSYVNLVSSNFTGPDKDWSQTTVFLDLPQELPTGRANIQVSGGGYADPPASQVNIIDGSGVPSSFGTEGGGLTDNQLKALGRVPHQTVRFTGVGLPHAIQLDLRHDPDRDQGGSGKAYVVNPRGDIKNLAWHDDGTDLRVILTPSYDQSIADLADFKFYVAGGVTGLYMVDVQAFDAGGNPLYGLDVLIE